MKTKSILFFAVASLISTALGQSECTANGYLDCLEGIISASSYTNCANLACVCDEVKVETACWTSYCPSIPLDDDLQTQFSNACGTPAGQYGGDSAPATTTAAGAGGGGSGGSSPTNAGQAPTATAGGAAGPASTSKAGGDIGVVVSGGGIMAVVLALLAYL